MPGARAWLILINSMGFRYFTPLLLTATIAGCGVISDRNSQNRIKGAPPSEGGDQVANEAGEIIRFRESFIASHTIYSTCKNLPYIAVTHEGKYFFSKAGHLGDQEEDWEALEEEAIAEHKGTFMRLTERNNVPIIASSNSNVDLSDAPSQRLSSVHFCAIIADSHSTIALAEQWLQGSDSLNAITARNLLRSQASINQPVLLSWTERPPSQTDDRTSNINEVNIEPGYRADAGEYMSEKGLHKIWPACRDIFNATPESSCSAPLSIEIGSS